MRDRRLITLSATILCASVWLSAQTQPAGGGYLLPPKAIVDILDAPLPPTIELSPTRDVVAVLERRDHADHRGALATRAAPRWTPHQSAHERTAPRAAIAVDHAQVDCRHHGEEGDGAGEPAADVGRLLARRQALRVHATRATTASSSGWATRRRARRKRSRPAQLNASLGTPCEWVGDGASLLCSFVPPGRGAPPRNADRAGRAQHSGEPRAKTRRSAPIRIC